jgi:hypothetical protein
MRSSFKVTLGFLVAATFACRDVVEPPTSYNSTPGPLRTGGSEVDTLSLTQDTYIREASPNRNYGSLDTLRTWNSPDRILVAIAQESLVAFIGQDSVVSATLQFKVKAISGTWNNTAVNILRMTQAWTQTGATWNCGIDDNTSNESKDCTSAQWAMNGPSLPWSTPFTDNEVIQTGVEQEVITLDVTTDIRAFLNGTPNFGWIIKKANENLSGRLVLRSRESEIPPLLILSVLRSSVPPQAPDTIAQWVYADSNIQRGSPAIPVPFLRRIILLRFVSGTTLAQRATAISLVGGTVVGGMTLPHSEGYYYISVPDSTPQVGQALLDGIAQLEQLNYVREASFEFSVSTHYRTPFDGTDFRQWRINPRQADGFNWNLERIGGPLAWGCSIGSTATVVAILDAGFKVVGDLTGNMTIAAPPVPGANAADGHGTNVASVLASRGNDTTDLTGVMWNANVLAYDINAPRANFDSLLWVTGLLKELRQAAYDGARVVNMSLGKTWGYKRPDTLSVLLPGHADSVATRMGRMLAKALEDLAVETPAPPHQPLIVISAGNDSTDAYWSGFPNAKSSTTVAGRIIVVGSTSLGDSIASSSNRGSLVDIYAPGVNIEVLDTTGTRETTGGTSVAAPLVTGAAGLLADFDPSLTAEEIKTLILDGARTGDSTAVVPGTKYLLNAYQALKLAGARWGAPLCGTHVWTAGGLLLAKRSSGPQVLDTLSEPAGLVNVAHGGRRIDLLSDITFDQRFDYNASTRTWSSSTNLTPDPRPSGTYLSSLTISHNSDSAVRVLTNTAGSTTSFQVQIFSTHTSAWQSLGNPLTSPFSLPGTPDCIIQEKRDTVIGGVPTVTPYECTSSLQTGTGVQAAARPSFSPLGDRVLVAINRTQTIGSVDQTWYPCPGTDTIPGTNDPRRQCRGYVQDRNSLDATVWQMSLPSGSSSQIGSSLSKEIFWMGLSEDGREFVAGEGVNENHLSVVVTATGFDTSGSYARFTGCQIGYRVPSTLVLSEGIASQDACEPFESAGSISPTAGRGPRRR